MLASRLAAALCVLPCAALAAEGALRLSVETGFDSNVRRDYDQTGTVADAEISLLGSANGRLQGDSSAVSGSYDVGFRKFIQYPAEDTLAQAANLDAFWALNQVLSVGAETHDKDRRGGDREYTDLSADAYLEYAPDSTLSARLRFGGERFIYWDNFAYSFTAPEAGVSGRYRFNRRHGMFFSADLGVRAYNAATSQTVSTPSPQQRQDTAINVVAGYSYRGPCTLSLSYNFYEQDSNSVGESFSRHRLVGTAGVRLPWRLYLLAEGALQYTVYPDGIYLSPDFQLIQDEENTNALSVKLARPVSEHVDVEAHYGVYYNHLPVNGLTYHRYVAWVGLTWRL